jgi:hypothetical protein
MTDPIPALNLTVSTFANSRTVRSRSFWSSLILTFVLSDLFGSCASVRWKKNGQTATNAKSMTAAKDVNWKLDRNMMRSPFLQEALFIRALPHPIHRRSSVDYRSVP